MAGRVKQSVMVATPITGELPRFTAMNTPDMLQTAINQLSPRQNKLVSTTSPIVFAPVQVSLGVQALQEITSVDLQQIREQHRAWWHSCGLGQTAVGILGRISQPIL